MPRKRTESAIAKAAAAVKVHVPEEIDESNTTGGAFGKTGFIETLSPMKQHNGERKTNLTINMHLYQFMADPHGHFVCEVLYPDDYAANMSIGQGYQPYTPPLDIARKAQPARPAPPPRTAAFAKAPGAAPRSNALPKAKASAMRVPPAISPASLLADPALG